MGLVLLPVVLSLVGPRCIAGHLVTGAELPVVTPAGDGCSDTAIGAGGSKHGGTASDAGKAHAADAAALPL